MLACITDSERALIEVLRQEQKGDDAPLQDIAAHRLDHSQGAILIHCGDGDRAFDIITHHSGIVARGCGEPRVHTLALNGGAVLISPTFQPENPRRRVLIEDAGEAMTLKEISTVVLYAHWPCAVAQGAKLSVTDTIEHLIAAKRTMRSSFPSAQVVAFFHVDFGHGKKRTYFVHARSYEMWRSYQTDAGPPSERMVA